MLTNNYSFSSKINPPQAFTYKEVIIEPMVRSPFIKFNEEKGSLIIKGDSLDVNEEFFTPIIALATEHLHSNRKLTCYFFFKNFNTPTAKVLFDLFQILENFKRQGRTIQINWFGDFENDKMIDAGIDFSDIFDLKFNIQPV